MWITRLRSGYRINLSDGEFEALAHLVNLGWFDMEGADDQLGLLSIAGKRAMRGTFGERGFMDVAEDRHAPV